MDIFNEKIEILKINLRFKWLRNSPLSLDYAVTLLKMITLLGRRYHAIRSTIKVLCCTASVLARAQNKSHSQMFKLSIYLLLALAHVGCNCDTCSGFDETVPIVATANGKVKGQLVRSPEGLPVQEYLGIPFGQPPVDKLRYAHPVPAKPWDGIFKAQKFGPSCYQYLDATYGEFEGSNMWNAPNELSEDCLYLNIWVPHPRPRKAAVMMWIYGGGFYSGTAALWVYDGKVLASRTGVILVSANYRVGSLGFLATGDERIKGNFGLMDHVLALKWIQKNIEAFGGDPDSVTLFGESAGASIIGLDMMSPISQDLFLRGIFQSGSPQVKWAFMAPQVARERSKLFFEAIGCPDDEQVLECLQNPKITPTDILNNEWVDGNFLVFPWVPTVDNFLVLDKPSNMIERLDMKKKQLLLGANKDEGTFWILYAIPTYKRNTTSLQSWSDLVDAINVVDYDVPPKGREAIFNYYTHWINPLDEAAIRDSLDEIVGDRSFLCPTADFANANVAMRKDTYFYYLEYRASTEVWPNWMGVIHGADIQWIFGIPMNKSRGYTDDEVVLSDRIMTYWTNFAKYGNPNGNEASGLPTWPRYNWREQYLDINGGFWMSRQSHPAGRQCDFWKVINQL